MIILSINYKLIVSTNLRQAMQHAKPFHRKSKDNIKNSTKKNFLEKFIFEPRTLLFHMEEISKYKATNSLIACKVSHCVYTLTLVKEKNMCKLPVKWIKYQFYNYGFSNSSVNIRLFRDFNCMMRFQLIKDLKELC